MQGRSSVATKRALALLLGAYVAVYLLLLGVRPLFIPDEYRYAEIPRELLAGGDWIAPHLAGLRYFEKPVLGYWVEAASLAAFGQSAFAARLPAALATGLYALLTAFAVKRSGEPVDTARLAAGVLLSSGLVFALGSYETLDALFTLFVTGCLVSAFLAGAGAPRKRLFAWALAGVAAGLAFLTKGLLGFVLPVLVLAPFLGWERRWRSAARHAWIAPLAALCVALPWSVAVALRDADFWRYFVWIQHVDRFASARASHREPAWFYLPLLLAGALPWVPLWPAAAAGLRARPRSSLLRYALCWLVFPLLFLSLSRGKLATYLLPSLPALAILTALGLQAAANSGSARWLRASLRALALLLAVPVVAGVALRIFLPGRDPVYGEQEGGRLAWVAIATLASCSAWLAAARARSPRRMLGLAMLAPFPLYAAFPFLVPESVLARKAPGELIARHAGRLAGAILVGEAALAPSVCWVARRSDVLVIGHLGELSYGARRPDAAQRAIDVDALRAILEAQGPGRLTVLVARQESYRDWAARLPAPTLEDEQGEFVYAEYAGR